MESIKRSIKQQLTRIKNTIDNIQISIEKLEEIRFRIKQIKRLMKKETFDSPYVNPIRTNCILCKTKKVTEGTICTDCLKEQMKMR